MENTKVQQILNEYKDDIPSDKVLYLKNMLTKADDSAFENIMLVETKNSTITLILSIFLGVLGVDRFYIEDIGLGVAKLLFGWMTFGIWPIVDIFCSFKKTKEINLNNIISVL